MFKVLVGAFVLAGAFVCLYLEAKYPAYGTVLFGLIICYSIGDTVLGGD